MDICDQNPEFEVFHEVSDYYKRIINVMRQMNYSEFDSDDYKRFDQELNELLKEKVI
jgi:V/A-type H+-transporting ATPase subunit A